MSRYLPLACVFSLVFVGCDGGTSDTDAGPGSSCMGEADGTECGSGLICIAGSCTATTCGDGFVDTAGGEECDDANEVAFDGCEPGSCMFTCRDNTDCSDGLICNGEETCSDTTHACAAGTAPDAGTACSTTEVTDGVCRGGQCVAAGCGNGVTDSGEQCDDMNETDGDGCDADCTFSCESAADCDDESVCTGTEACDTTTHACVTGTMLECDDGNACTSNECDPVMGCVYPLIDADLDGHAPTSLGACGTDCDDTRDDINPDQQEQCDAVDHDCDNSDVPASTPYWYRDCDDDGFAVAGAPSMQVCDEPPPQPCGGGWTTQAPLSAATTDCDDSDMRARPNQTMYFDTAANGGGFDFNCDGTETKQYTSTNVDEALCFSINGSFCYGADGWTGTTAPNCGVAAQFNECYNSCISRGCVSCSRRTLPTSVRQACR